MVAASACDVVWLRISEDKKSVMFESERHTVRIHRVGSWQANRHRLIGEVWLEGERESEGGRESDDTLTRHTGGNLGLDSNPSESYEQRHQRTSSTVWARAMAASTRTSATILLPPPPPHFTFHIKPEAGVHELDCFSDTIQRMTDLLACVKVRASKSRCVCQGACAPTLRRDYSLDYGGEQD